MSNVRPFRGLRPRPELVEKVASPPYDVMNSSEARQMARGNPLSFLRVVKAEIDLDPDADVHGEPVYAKSLENLRGLEKQGALIRDPDPCFYLYQLIMDGHKQIGVMFGASCDEYRNGLIKKHEFTRPQKEDDRARHVAYLSAQTGPVMLTYKASAEIDQCINAYMAANEPVYDFVAADGVTHTMWAMCGERDVAGLQKLFGDVDALYIADGHHRSAAATRVSDSKTSENPAHTGEEPYNFFLGVAFPDDQLQIMGYYRAVRDLNGLSPDELLSLVGKDFEVGGELAGPPDRRHCFGMYLDGRWYRLTAKPGSFPEGDPVLSLDVAILQENLLNPILGIGDPRTDERVEFIGGIRGPAELERRCGIDMKVAFSLYPTSVSELIAIADTGNVMPPKSTWFEPKLRSGMVVREL